MNSPKSSNFNNLTSLYTDLIWALKDRELSVMRPSNFIS